MEELKYVIEDSTIAELLGVQNFSTDEAAILELVKNAYDANALNLKITFQNDTLRFEDNGIGMNADDIKKHWMHIGKSSKEYEIIDENNKKRIQAGSKGVGRFALSRLGYRVCLKSKKIDSVGVIWKTDWNTSVLDENYDIHTKGTDIEIIGLREKWNKKRIENLNKYLERTYHDTSMEIRIISDNYDEIVVEHFPKAEVGINCRSNIVLKYNQGILVTSVESDEFENEALKYCSGIDIKKYETKTDIVNELKGNKITELLDADIQTVVNDIGEFSANLYFNISTSKDEKEKFLYKYLNTPKNIESGIILYRNAFSISSYEGRKDWLGLGKRSRKSPAAASHPTGAWRVRENQMAGYVMIDKKKNAVLQDMANRQGFTTKRTLTNYDADSMVCEICRSYIVNVHLCFETFLKDVCRQINKYGKNEYKPRIQEESYLSCAVRNICGNNLSDDMKPLYELCEYYRLIRNTSVHDLCEVDSHEKEYRKLQKYNFKTEAKFSKLVAPNKYEEISFDDFVMFSRSCVELAIYIFEKMAYDYTKIALDIPDKQISKWRKYSKNRQEKALCSYIKTLYKVDEEFIEQIPKLLNMIIDPIV